MFKSINRIPSSNPILGSSPRPRPITSPNLRYKYKYK